MLYNILMYLAIGSAVTSILYIIANDEINDILFDSFDEFVKMGIQNKLIKYLLKLEYLLGFVIAVIVWPIVLLHNIYSTLKELIG